MIYPKDEFNSIPNVDRFSTRQGSNMCAYKQATLKLENGSNYRIDSLCQLNQI